MSQFTIKSIDKNKPTKEGKTRGMAVVIGPDGTESTDVTVWGDYPGFADLAQGSVVDANVVAKTIKGRVWKSLYAVKTDTLTSPSYRRASAPKPEMIKMMDKKQDNIEKTMDRKDENIKKSSVFRDTTILTNAFVGSHGEELTMEDIQAIWDQWHKWLDARYDAPF